MIKKVVFIAKTDLNVDGRILNQIKILFRAKILDKIEFILLPDKPYENHFENVTVCNINSRFRNRSFFRVFTVIDTTIKSLKHLFDLKPNLLHVQDTAVVLPALIYRFIKGKSFKLIYDDHELPNENESIQYRFYQYLERILMQKADLVLFANKERLDLIQNKLSLRRVDYFLNLPYFDNESELLDTDLRFNELNEEVNSGTKLIIHQGSLEVERGREKLADFSKSLPPSFKILIIGVDKSQYLSFINEYDLNQDHFYFFGVVKYELLDLVWSKCIASIVMYLPTYINNRLCAPNRLYISLKNGIPAIVNKDNPVLSNMISSMKCGYFIENFQQSDFNQLKKDFVFSDQLHSLREQNFIKLTDLYSTLINS